MTRYRPILSLALAALPWLAGCSDLERSQSPIIPAVPYTRKPLDTYTTLMEIDYEGRRHVFVHGYQSMAKLGDYPIPGPASAERPKGGEVGKE